MYHHHHHRRAARAPPPAAPRRAPQAPASSSSSSSSLSSSSSWVLKVWRRRPFALLFVVVVVSCGATVGVLTWSGVGSFPTLTSSSSSSSLSSSSSSSLSSLSSSSSWVKRLLDRGASGSSATSDSEALLLAQPDLIFGRQHGFDFAPLGGDGTAAGALSLDDALAFHRRIDNAAHIYCQHVAERRRRAQEEESDVDRKNTDLLFGGVPVSVYVDSQTHTRSYLSVIESFPWADTQFSRHVRKRMEQYFHDMRVAHGLAEKQAAIARHRMMSRSGGSGGSQGTTAHGHASRHISLPRSSLKHHFHFLYTRPEVDVFFVQVGDLQRKWQLSEPFPCPGQAFSHIDGEVALLKGNLPSFLRLMEERIDAAIASGQCVVSQPLSPRSSSLTVNPEHDEHQYHSTVFRVDGIIPRTYRMFLPDECKAFFRTWFERQGEPSAQHTQHQQARVGNHEDQRSESNDPQPPPVFAWIEKVVDRHRQTGLQLLTHDDVLKRYVYGPYASGSQCGYVKQQVLVQQYINNPLLLNGHKSDLRIFMVVANARPLTVFFHVGYARLATISMSSANTTLQTTAAHFTGTNAARQGNAKFSTADAVQANEHKWTFARLQQYLFTHGLVSDAQWVHRTLVPQLKRIMVYSMASIRERLHHQPGRFGYYGLDVVLDTDLRPWLIEINKNAGLKIDADSIGPTITSLTGSLSRFVVHAARHGLDAALAENESLASVLNEMDAAYPNDPEVSRRTMVDHLRLGFRAEAMRREWRKRARASTAASASATGASNEFSTPSWLGLQPVIVNDHIADDLHVPCASHILPPLE